MMMEDDGGLQDYSFRSGPRVVFSSRCGADEDWPEIADILAVINEEERGRWKKNDDRLERLLCLLYLAVGKCSGGI